MCSWCGVGDGVGLCKFECSEPYLLDLAQTVRSLTSTPQLQLHDKLIMCLYFKVKFDARTGSEVAYGILEVGAVRMQSDFNSTT